MPIKAVLLIASVITLGASVALWGALNWVCPKPLDYACILALAAFFSLFKVKMPGIAGTYSANSVFVLIAVAQFSLSETILLAMCAGTVQCLYRAAKKPTLTQVLFNASVFGIGGACAFGIYRAVHPVTDHGWIGSMIYAMLVFFLVNTFLVSMVIGLIEQKATLAVWRTWHIWSLPYYAANGLLAFLITSTGSFSILIALMTAPLICSLFFYYRLRLKTRLPPGKSANLS